MKTIIFVLTTVLCIISMPGYLLANTIVTDGLVSYWTFDLNNINGNLVEDVWGENHAELSGRRISLMDTLDKDWN